MLSRFRERAMEHCLSIACIPSFAHSNDVFPEIRDGITTLDCLEHCGDNEGDYSKQLEQIISSKLYTLVGDWKTSSSFEYDFDDCINLFIESRKQNMSMQSYYNKMTECGGDDLIQMKRNLEEELKMEAVRKGNFLPVFPSEGFLSKQQAEEKLQLFEGKPREDIFMCKYMAQVSALNISRFPDNDALSEITMVVYAIIEAERLGVEKSDEIIFLKDTANKRLEAMSFTSNDSDEESHLFMLTANAYMEAQKGNGPLTTYFQQYEPELCKKLYIQDSVFEKNEIDEELVSTCVPSVESPVVDVTEAAMQYPVECPTADATECPVLDDKVDKMNLPEGSILLFSDEAAIIFPSKSALLIPKGIEVTLSSDTTVTFQRPDVRGKVRNNEQESKTENRSLAAGSIVTVSGKAMIKLPWGYEHSVPGGAEITLNDETLTTFEKGNDSSNEQENMNEIVAGALIHISKNAVVKFPSKLEVLIPRGSLVTLNEKSLVTCRGKDHW